MQQSSATPKNQRCRDWVAEDTCSCILSILLAVPSCIKSFWHGVIPTSYFIFIFILVSPIFYAGLALSAIIVARGETRIYVYTYVRTCVLCAGIATEVVTCTCNKR